MSLTAQSPISAGRSKSIRNMSWPISIAWLVLRERGDLARADYDFSQAIRLDPRGAAAYANRGLVKEQLGSREQALADFEAAITLDANRIDALAGRTRTRAAAVTTPPKVEASKPPVPERGEVNSRSTAYQCGGNVATAPPGARRGTGAGSSGNGGRVRWDVEAEHTDCRQAAE